LAFSWGSTAAEYQLMCVFPPPHFDTATRVNAGETILIVDDEPTVRMLITEVLEGLCYAAIEAANANSALKVLQSDVRVDLLITDIGSRLADGPADDRRSAFW
jgi:response regulator RpfG family c-di-GMP phosphodiesterase